MPFFKNTPPEGEQQGKQALQDAEASLHSLEAGRLPLQAQRRLHQETDTDHSLFTSDLSVKEFMLTRNKGYAALSQVMGSSIYQVGWQYNRGYTWNSRAVELTTLTSAHQEATLLALKRLEAEATLIHAHGVIGVRFTRRNYEWGQNLLEYTAIGTAITLPDTPVPSRPFLSDLSGQEFWTLLQAGYYPQGITTGFCSYYVSLGSNIAGQLRGWFGGSGYNQEIMPFTQGIYTSRTLAMNRLETSARNLNATGVVGMQIEIDRKVYDYEIDDPKRYYMDLFVQISMIGTAISALKDDHIIPTPQLTLSFADLHHDQVEEVHELVVHE